ncbi:MAG: carboxypeptidase-like regulatory domain-containing protein [bacterium]|nr:carboxypeptidase-like regulatory domain-containing protein [bacterium]
MDPREEDELRQLIRRELENRERLREQPEGEPSPRWAEHASEERRRVIEEEIERFYRAKGGYRRFENEDGDVEWLTEAELLEREQQIPVDMEELEVGQRRVRNRLVATVILVVLGAALLMILLRERTGSVQVICNEPGATVHLNGSPTEFITDTWLRNLPAGPHLISVSKYGFVADSQSSRRVDLRAGETEVVILKLKPTRTDSVSGSR